MSETIDIEVKKRTAYFARYINRYGRRNSYSKLGKDNIRRTFQDGKWVEIHVNDATWFQKQAQNNVTWEFKTEEVIDEIQHYYVKFNGFNTKTVLEIPQYDKDDYGDAILKTKRDYKLPKDSWIYCNPKDAQYFRRSAKVNTFLEFQEIKLPTTIQPPIKLVGQTPRDYQNDVYADIRENDAITTGGSILYDKVIGVKTEVKAVKEVVENVVEKVVETTTKSKPKKKKVKRKVKKKPVSKEENN